MSERPERPAPPQLPKGWKAQWDEEYNRYFYVNEKTGASQWELPDKESEDNTNGQEVKPDITAPSYAPNDRNEVDDDDDDGDGDNEQTDRGIGTFVKNQAINQLTGGNRNKKKQSGGIQSFVVNQAVNHYIGGAIGGKKQSSGSSVGNLVGNLVSGSTNNNNNKKYGSGVSSGVGQVIGDMLIGKKK